MHVFRFTIYFQITYQTFVPIYTNKQYINESYSCFKCLSALYMVSLFFKPFLKFLRMWSWISLWFKFAFPWKLMKLSTFSYGYWMPEFLILWTSLFSIELTDFPYWFGGVLWVRILCQTYVLQISAPTLCIAFSVS